MTDGNSKNVVRDILVGIFVAIISGIIVAIIVGDGRFSASNDDSYPNNCSITENFSVPFNEGKYAKITANEYNGNVLVNVSGTGQASGYEYNDAFYVFTDASGTNIQPHIPENWILTINGQHANEFIPGKQIPSYQEDHEYNFNILAPGGKLTFGIDDGYTEDNSGSYKIELCAIQ